VNFIGLNESGAVEVGANDGPCQPLV